MKIMGVEQMVDLYDEKKNSVEEVVKENDIKKRGWDKKLAMKIIGIGRMVDLSDEEKKGVQSKL